MARPGMNKPASSYLKRVVADVWPRYSWDTDLTYTTRIAKAGSTKKAGTVKPHGNPTQRKRKKKAP